jgi:hypothetical protein
MTKFKLPKLSDDEINGVEKVIDWFAELVAEKVVEKIDNKKFMPKVEGDGEYCKGNCPGSNGGGNFCHRYKTGLLIDETNLKPCRLSYCNDEFFHIEDDVEFE